MVAGYHIIMGMYGFWLPNDQRGSWSEFVGSHEMARYGGATTTATRTSVAGRRRDHAQKELSKRALKYPAAQLTGIQARAIARGFDTYFRKSGVPCWACAILPDHVHLVVGAADLLAETLATQLKCHATKAMKGEHVHPMTCFATQRTTVPKCFARGQWVRFLNRQAIGRAIRYVEENPVKEHLPRQRWAFVQRFDGDDV